MAVVPVSWKAFGDRPWTAQMEKKLRMVRQLPPGKMLLALCAVCFAAGLLQNGRVWGDHMRRRQNPASAAAVAGAGDRNSGTPVVPAGAECELIKRRLVSEQDGPVIGDVMGEVARTHKAIQSLEKTISSLEMGLSVTRTTTSGARSPAKGASGKSAKRGPTKKAFMVVGINTAFSSRKRRDSLRETWVPRGPKLKRMEEEKGIVVRFVIGRSATPGGALDRAIDAEEAATEDFLRLRDHVEAYHELSAKTRLYFATAAAAWDADFYVKVDDDVHLNIGMLAATLARHRTKPRVYVGCMKSGPVLSQKGLKYHEPEFMKFGDEGNNYFMHATGQIYAVSKDLAAYISTNAPILHRYANEDVSMGSWLIGLEVEHVDDRTMCCGTPPDCELKAEAGNVCVATFDWSCSGICRSVDRMKDVHDTCGEGDEAIWTVPL